MASDRAINLALRVLGIGEVERDFRRVGEAGGKAFADVRKSSNGAAQEVSEYTRRLRAAVVEAKKLADQQPALNRPTRQSRVDRASFIRGAVGAEQDRILKGLPDVTRGFDAAEAAAGGFAGRLGAVGLTAGGVTVALGALALGTKEAAQAFMEHERALDAFNAELALAGNRSTASGTQIEATAERVTKATLQTEKSVLQAAAELARVPGITKVGLEAALSASARLADALGTDVTDQAEKTAGVLTALANKDMAALVKATEGVNDELRAAVLQLAETGKTADAQKAYLAGLAKAAGDGPDGLTSATNQLSKSWEGLKRALGEDIAAPAGESISWLSRQLDTLKTKIEGTSFSWKQLLADGALLATNGFGGLAGRVPGYAPNPTDTYDRPEAGFAEGLLRELKGRGGAAAQVKAFEEKYGSSSKSSSGSAARTAAQAMAQFEAELRKRGIKVISDFRTAAEQNALFRKGATDLDGYVKLSRHQTRQAVDVDKTTHNDDAARAAAQAAGLKGFEIVTESGGRKHYEWSGHGKPGELDIAGSERAMAAAARAKEQASRREAQFTEEMLQLDEQLLDVRHSQVTDAAELARLAKQDVALAAERQRAEVDEKQRRGEYTAAQADALREKIKGLASERSAAIDADEARRRGREALDIAQSRADVAADLLQAEGSLADTAADRRKIELKLLDLAEAQMRARLQAVIADETASDAAKADARARLAALGQISGAQREGVMRATTGPAEAYLRSLQKSGNTLGEQYEASGVRGLQSLNDGLADAILGFRSLGDVGREVLSQLASDFLKLSIEQNLTRPLAEALFPDAARTLGLGGGKDGLGAASGMASVQVTTLGTSAGAAAIALNRFVASLATGPAAGGGGLGGGIGSLLGSILGGGITAAGAARLAPDVASTIAANPALFASGTDRVPTGKPFWVGENGRELMERTPDGGLRVHSNQQAHRMLEGGGESFYNTQIINIPERADPRRSASSIARSTQGAIVRANRKGLATMRGNR